jgi:hypothetical protein
LKILAHFPGHGHGPCGFVDHDSAVFEGGQLGSQLWKDIPLGVNVRQAKHDEFHDQGVIARICDHGIERRRILSNHNRDVVFRTGGC